MGALLRVQSHKLVVIQWRPVRLPQSREHAVDCAINLPDLIEWRPLRQYNERMAGQVVRKDIYEDRDYGAPTRP